MGGEWGGRYLRVWTAAEWSGAVAAAGDNGRPFIEAVGCRYKVWWQECAGTGPGIKYHLPWRADKQQSVIINHEHYPNGIVPLPGPCSVKSWLLFRMKNTQTNMQSSNMCLSLLVQVLDLLVWVLYFWLFSPACHQTDSLFQSSHASMVTSWHSTPDLSEWGSK